MGVIFYISAVNDEVSHRKPPANPQEGMFTYSYGWAFFFAGGSFIASMMCSVTNTYLYLSRYSNLDDMVMIIPGLDKRHGITVLSPTEEENNECEIADYARGAHNNPTVIL